MDLHRFASVIACMLLLVVGTAQAQQASADAVLAQMIDTYGGAQNLRKLDSMVQEWDLVALMGNRHGSDRRSVSVPGQLKVELTYPHKKETRLLNGSDSYVIFGDDAATAARPMQMDAMRLQLMRLYSPLALQDRLESVYAAEDGDFIVLSLWENELRCDYYVRRGEWRIEKVVGTLSVNGMQMSFVTEYSDFTEVDGVLVHQSENKFAGNVNTAVLKLRDIVFGVEFGAAEFQPSSDVDQGVITM